VDHLLEVAQGLGLREQHRTLFGAFLATRYGPGLREHVAQLMTRLQGRRIVIARDAGSLLDAFVLISLPYAYEIVDLQPALLSDVFGVDWPTVVTRILEPLGDEAAITFSSDRVVVRHEMIAAAVVDVALEWGLDLQAAVSRLVGAAARRIARDGYIPQNGSIAYLASRITDLPRLAVAAAIAAHEAVPSRLSYVTHLSAAFRRNGQALQAAETNEANVRLLSDAGNADQGRAFLSEWGVAEGNCDRWARNAVLVSMALQDSYSLGAVTSQRSRGAVSCLLLALRRLNDARGHEDLLKGMAALSVISRAFGIPDPNTRAWLRAAERAVDAGGVTYPELDDVGAMDRSLKSAIAVARDRLESPLPRGLPSPIGSFADLARCARG
jgi:hypothetical protein